MISSWIIFSIFVALTGSSNAIIYKLLGNILEPSIITLITFLPLIFIFGSLNYQNLFNYKNLNFFILLSGALLALYKISIINSIKRYHNPGIIVALKQLQIPLTFIITSIIYLNVNFRHLIIIIFLIVGAILVGFDFKKKRMIVSKDKNYKLTLLNNEWAIYLFLSIVFFSLYDITIKFNKAELDFKSKLFLQSFGASITILIVLFINKFKNNYLLKKYPNNIGYSNKTNIVHKNHKHKLVYTISLIILLIIINILQVFSLNNAVKLSKYPSSAKAIASLSLVITLILSALIFKTVPNFIQIMGAIIIVISSILIALY